MRQLRRDNYPQSARRRRLLLASLTTVTGLAVIAVIVIAFMGAVLIFLPTRLVESDLENQRKRVLSPTELLKAKNDVRTTLLQAVGGLVLLGGAIAAWRQIGLGRQHLQATQDHARRNEELTRSGQITERFTRAIDQLGSDKRDIRLGGIYALERLSKDSIDDRGPVLEVLTTFLREHSRLEQVVRQRDSPIHDVSANGDEERLQADLQAAATVIGRMDRSEDRADLSGVRLPGVSLQRANLHDANLANAYLRQARLAGANLFLADLTRADLTEAILSEAVLDTTDLQESNLQGADLRGADLSTALNVTREQLKEAITDDSTKLPPGVAEIPE